MSAITYIFGGIAIIGLIAGLVAIIGGGLGTRKEEQLWHHDGEW